jgi:hypothetical protein
MAETPIYLEVGKKRVFACALDWPGWCRVDKSEDEAIARLAEYAPRFAVVAAEAGVRFPRTAARSLTVVERVAGSGTTDFGAPGAAAKLDAEPATAAEAKRLGALVAASWRILEDVADRAPQELAKGPRGGGRDRNKVVQHVLGAEANYARLLDVRHREPALDDANAIEAMRQELRAALEAKLRTAATRPKGWLPRYAARRIAWHALDHAWEIEDRGGLEPRCAW